MTGKLRSVRAWAADAAAMTLVAVLLYANLTTRGGGAGRLPEGCGRRGVLRTGRDRLRMGNHQGADAMFAEAHARGRDFCCSRCVWWPRSASSWYSARRRSAAQAKD